MNHIKRVLRMVGLIILILLAACGFGFVAGIGRIREQDRDPVVKTEIVEEMNGPESEKPD